MKKVLFFMAFCFASYCLQAQVSDFIVLKSKKNRTLKTYFPGTFISATTYDGFTLNGIIKKIVNDSLFVEQQNIYQVPTQFGVPRLDTLFFTVALPYTDVREFDYASNIGPGGAPRHKGFQQISIPRIMIIGGVGYVVLELVNSAYRNESLSDQNKLAGMGIAGGVAVTGFLWQQLKNRNKEGKYKVLYINMHEK